MAIVRTPRRSVRPSRNFDELNDLVNRFFGPQTDSQVGDWFPAVNVREDAEGLVLTAELPGMNANEVEIEFENNVLTLRGEKKEERSEGGGEQDRYHIWERRFGSFQRSFTLPRTVRSEDIEASFDEGVLTVRLPKSSEAKSRKIAVQSSASA